MRPYCDFPAVFQRGHEIFTSQLHIRLTLKTRERRPPSFAARAADAQKMLRVQRDPRYLELQAALQAGHAARGVEKSGKNGPQWMGTLDETKASWIQHHYSGLRMLIETVNMSLDPKMAEKQLDEAYKWFQSSKQPGSASCKVGDWAPNFHNFCAEEVLPGSRPPPGSAHFTPQVENEGEPTTSNSLEKVEDWGKTILMWLLGGDVVAAGDLRGDDVIN